MGKISPSLRSTQFPLNAVLKPQPQFQTSHPLTKPFIPHHKRSNSQTLKKIPKSTNPNPFPSADLTAAKSLISSLPSSSLSPKSTNSLLQSFVASSPQPSLPDARSLLSHILHTHPHLSPDRSTYHILLSLSPTRETVSLMEAEGFAPDQATVDVSVRALCGRGNVEDAVDLVKEFCLKNCLPDAFTYNYLLKCLCRNRELASVNTFIHEMREAFGVKPDLISYTILIDNVCNRKNLREATRLLDLLAEDGFKPDLYVYNTIMKGHCMLGQGGEVLGVFWKMQEQGVVPDLVTYNTLIFGLSKCGRVGDAKKFLNLMAEEGHFPDAVTYTSLMNGMCRERDALGAVLLLREMEAKGCVPNSCTYNTLLTGLSKERILDKAVELYGVMRETGMVLESGSYGAFLRALCKKGRVAEAYEVFDYAVESKSLKEVFAYSTLESTLKWLKKAREQGLAV